MPNIPFLPGVPSLSSYSTNNVALLFADVISIISDFFGPQWGIYLDGAKAFPYRSVVDFEYKQDFPVSDYTVEEGGFQSYNKVELPFDVKVRISSDGDALSRQALLTEVRAAANGLDLYDVVTPEETYSSCNITHIDWRRSSENGVGLVIIDIWFVEIRITATSTFTNTQNPVTSGQQNTGSVAPQTPNQRVQQGFNSGDFSVQ